MEDGYRAARVAMINSLGTIKANIGNLKRVKRFIKLLGMVNCVADFVQQPEVINGASDLLDEVFGRDVALHARSAVGMHSLPRATASKSKRSWSSNEVTDPAEDVESVGYRHSLSD